jgi:ADP-heptose:LPS heptosyltransferase
VRVLIVLPGAIGDVVRALPLLGRLRRARPEAHIGWAVEPPSAPLLAGHPWLDEVIVFDRAGGVGAFLAHLRRVRAGRWTMALDLGRSLKSGIVARASGARQRLGFAHADGREGNWLFTNVRLPVQGPERSKLAQMLAFGDALGLPAAPVEFGLAPTGAEAREAEALLLGLPGPLVAACVGSSCPSRRWFPDRTAAVLRALREREGGSAVLLGTTADARFAAEVVRRSDRGVRDLVGRTSLRQLLAVLGRAHLAVGPDSGALHLAAAVGVPTVSLWGATSAARSAPWASEPLAIAGSAPCAPCFRKTCPIGRVCMRTIEVDAVVERAPRALAVARAPRRRG